MINNPNVHIGFGDSVLILSLISTSTQSWTENEAFYCILTCSYRPCLSQQYSTYIAGACFSNT